MKTLYTVKHLFGATYVTIWEGEATSQAEANELAVKALVLTATETAVLNAQDERAKKEFAMYATL